MEKENSQLSASQKYNFNQIKQMIEKGFMHNGAVSIEYAVKTEKNYTKWLKWDKPLYALKDADQVMAELKKCCSNNPECSMKLICEQFSPECRLVYCIHRQQTKENSSE